MGKGAVPRRSHRAFTASATKEPAELHGSLPTDTASDGDQEVALGIYVEFDREGHSIGVEVTSVHLLQTGKLAASAKDAAE